MSPAHPSPGAGGGTPQRIAYYDDACGFCRRCCDRLRRADRRSAIRFIAGREASAPGHAVPAHELAASLVVIDPATARRWHRAQALAALAVVLPFPWNLLRGLAVPGIAPLADRAYDQVARHRGWLSRRWGHDRCELDSSVAGDRRRNSESVRG
jgi:predicted DCC family thiol-disulfide oxidoreductase YuxK